MNTAFSTFISQQLQQVKDDGLYKNERVIHSQQQAAIAVEQGQVVNFCANNYLGLANSPALIEAAKAGLDSHGFGAASVRFICGTQDIHKKIRAGFK
jgi:glycine C-acetyltransferase